MTFEDGKMKTVPKTYKDLRPSQIICSGLWANLPVLCFRLCSVSRSERSLGAREQQGQLQA